MATQTEQTHNYLNLMLLVVVVVVEQATTPTAWMSCPGREIPGRSGFAFHNSKALGGWWQSGRGSGSWLAGWWIRGQTVGTVVCVQMLLEAIVAVGGSGGCGLAVTVILAHKPCSNASQGQSTRLPSLSPGELLTGDRIQTVTVNRYNIDISASQYTGDRCIAGQTAERYPISLTVTTTTLPFLPSSTLTDTWLL